LGKGSEWKLIYLFGKGEKRRKIPVFERNKTGQAGEMMEAGSSP
jgi:hypothetical protein